jgi:hypothetical protein
LNLMVDPSRSAGLERGVEPLWMGPRLPGPLPDTGTD